MKNYFWKSSLGLLFLIFSICVFARVTSPYPFTEPGDATRFAALTQEIRCVVCQNQSLADSNAPLAHDLRDKIYQMVLDKQSDEEIKNFLADRYGEFILLRPRFNKLTLLLWGFPLLGLIAIGWFFYRFPKLRFK